MQKATRSIARLIVAVSVLSGVTALRAFADENVSKDVKDAASDTKTNIKKSARKVKRHARKATGTDTVGKDIKDKANDVGDDVNNTVEKAKH